MKTIEYDSRLHIVRINFARHSRWLQRMFMLYFFYHNKKYFGCNSYHKHGFREIKCKLPTPTLAKGNFLLLPL